MVIFHRELLNFQRVDLHFLLVFPWFSYDFPIQTSVRVKFSWPPSSKPLWNAEVVSWCRPIWDWFIPPIYLSTWWFGDGLWHCLTHITLNFNWLVFWLLIFLHDLLPTFHDDIFLIFPPKFKVYYIEEISICWPLFVRSNFHEQPRKRPEFP